MGVLLCMTLSTTAFSQMYSLKDVILNKQNDYYTITVATVVPSVDYRKYIEDNGIKYNAVAYHFGQKNKYVKILFGAFKTQEEAFEVMVRLNSTLLTNRPIIEKVNKHINLFFKYDNKIEDE